MDSIGWIIISLITLFLLGQFALVYRTRGMQGRPAPDLSDLISEEQKAHETLYFYFHSPRCGMCREVSAVLDPLMSERTDIIGIDVSRRPDMARRFKVMGTPTLMRVRDGRIEKVLMGTRNEDVVRAFIG
ncbi:thioredoxin family protein [Ectothiorhodospira shaposhnikovii]|uniref:thioredoxin family protein n=1 Tax=Ectothiorhodospira shaposhnikovii TaxID=1054 RepID=UPI001EE84DA0|nr:thioredoxin family protein [Ectothiorhodospira shaposhnikovii]MCG5513122.1 thioredoxin family protein [Ectothiorhodospira shaposhnikovii]